MSQGEHWYCLVVQAGFYCNVVECSLLHARDLGSNPAGTTEIFFKILRVHDNCLS